MSDKPETIDELLRKRREKEAASEQELPDASSTLPEPEWIHDTNAAPVGGGIGLELHTDAELLSLCEGEKQYCGFCGKAFPIWPMTDCARHSLDEHKAEITVQGQQTYSLQCVPGMTQFGQQWIGALFNVRVSIRRRAWQLGFVRVINPGEGPSILDPDGKLPGRRAN